MSEQQGKPASVATESADELRLRVLCADGVVHYRFGQDVSTFRSLEVALEWADEFAAKPGVGQMCGPHRIGRP